MSVREWVAVYLKGAAMGAADAVPGVSGGTIALITGIYDRFITALAGLDPREAWALLPFLARVHQDDARAELRAALGVLDVPFLVVLGLGVVSAAVTVANLVEAARTTYPALTYAFFFGLIAASVVVLWSELDLTTPNRKFVAVLGFALAFAVSGQASATLPAGLATMFVAGAIAICAMVLPGVSGSLLLLTLGQYHVITSAVETATDAVLNANLGNATAPVTTLAAFSLGAAVGIVSFARVVAWALDTYRAATLTFLVALMAGALRAPGQVIVDETTAWTPETALALLAVAAVGALAVLGLERATGDITY
ncbi:DUF368 domain-containing protein [Salarchaeum sp. JOR-1]|uniref:DUF368 domain-containing protein n=1 Tax=Salarchaeum sp. JOR-1 TaxID=2599399 RepID=UPI001198B12E|nr:DUF368 domain-containing protein [Salarchaeum sp. JOR-1]QDX41036.1 DUF368 domain-containing protein [Salarchaeum sp. JOR-1]